MKNNNIEIRSFNIDNVESRHIVGYSVVYNTPSVDLGGFREIIAPTAINQELINRSDIIMNYQHSDTMILARSRNGQGTLQLSITEKGLMFEFDMPNSSLGDQILESIHRGDISTCSFAFSLPNNSTCETWERTNDGIIRTIHEIGQLYDCAIVTNAAYPATSVSARSLEMINKLNSEMKEEEILREDPKEEDVKPEEPQTEEPKEEEPKEEEKEEPKEEPKEEEKPEEEPEDNEEEKPEKEEKSINKSRFNKMEKRFSLLKAIRSIVNENKLDAVSQAVVNAGQEECRNSGLSFAGQIQIPVGQPMEERAVVTVTAEGEDVVVTDFTNILEPLRAKNVLASAGATFLTGLVGDLQIPSMSAEQVFWEGEVTSTSDGAGAFSHIKMSPRRISAYIDVSKQFLVQDSLGAEELIRRDLVNAINTKLESTILGSSAASGNVPAGIFYNVAATECDTFADLCNLEADVEETNINGEMKYILSPKAKAILRAMPKSEKHTQLVLDTDNIDGTPFETTTNMAQTYFAYGDWSNLYIGQWGPIDLLIDPYTQATKGTVRIVVNAFFDYAVVRSGAIVYGKAEVAEG